VQPFTRREANDEDAELEQIARSVAR